MFRIIIIGSGQIGSRHLQAMRSVNFPLEIMIVDPSIESLKTAQERYNSMPDGEFQHIINPMTDIPNGQIFDLGIVATCSDIRAKTIKKLVVKNKIKYLILEKILFNKKNDYSSIENLLKKNGIKAWVNCPMRMMPFYENINKEFNGQKISYFVTGSKIGLITDTIHYLDHMSYLIGNNNFKLLTDGLKQKLITSKRKGFLELEGTINVLYKNGSTGSLTFYSQGSAPTIVEIHSSKARVVCRETEEKAWISKETNNWRWEEVLASVPYQSHLTTGLTKSILNKGRCNLATLEESIKTHLRMLEPLQKFINKFSKKRYNYYPFT